MRKRGWKGRGFSEKLPTLDEALATIPDGRKLYLHCYCADSDLGQVQEAIIRSGKRPGQVVFICFDLGACQKFKQMRPQNKAYWLCGYGPKSPAIGEIIHKAKAGGVEGINLDFHFPIDKALVQEVHQAGLEMHVWTVDDVSEARKLMDAGVDSITTNRPGWLREQLGLPLGATSTPSTKK